MVQYASNSRVVYWLGGLQESHIKDQHLPLNSQFFVVYQDKDELVLEEVYDVSPAGPRVWGEVARWRPGSGFTSTTDFWQRRGDLQGEELKVVTLPGGRFVEVLEDTPSSWQGVVPDILNSLAASLNFTFTINFSSDGKWGSPDKVEDWFTITIILGNW